jgi:citrate lyase subunit beta/citryl-CoA lyase
MRSKLFVPAIRPDLFPKAIRSDADAICFDLEDAVPSDRKSEARNHIAKFLSSSASATRKLLLVRVNAARSDDLIADLNAVAQPSLPVIALPKVESSTEIQEVANLLSTLERERHIQNPISLLITIESPHGLRSAHELAMASPRICGLQLGFADLLEPLGISSDQDFVRQQIRLTLRLAAGEAGVDCYEAAYPQLHDHAGFVAQITAARSLGFSGVSCIHPSQIESANAVFTPTESEVTYARRVIAAAQEAERTGQAVAVLDGKMIDPPFVLRAQSILRQAAIPTEK